ncbi:hydroxyisourate hydrolase [Colwelliaceae bacterium 6471]
MSQITTHVLDTTRGKPAPQLPISLYAQIDNGWELLASGVTNEDGRIAGLLDEQVKLPAGVYRMHFQTSAYFNANNEAGFYPYVDIVFELDDSGAHYHIPLLLTAFGYSTYRGS